MVIVEHVVAIARDNAGKIVELLVIPMAKRLYHRIAPVIKVSCVVGLEVSHLPNVAFLT